MTPAKFCRMVRKHGGWIVGNVVHFPTPSQLAQFLIDFNKEHQP